MAEGEVIHQSENGAIEKRLDPTTNLMTIGSIRFAERSGQIVLLGANDLDLHQDKDEWQEQQYP